MSMRDIHLGVRLDFETPEQQEDSEEILDRLLGVVCRLNKQHLRRNPNTPSLYESGVRYSPPDQARAAPDPKALKKIVEILKGIEGVGPEIGDMVVRIVRGVETFADIPTLYRRGHGDCNELAPVRVAELWRAGINARAYLTVEPNDRGGKTYHCVVQWPDGSSEDPSLILGMGGPEREADRQEEIRKNKERWSNYMAAAQHLVEAEGVSPKVAGKQIDLMGLLPRDGVFRV